MAESTWNIEGVLTVNAIIKSDYSEIKAMGVDDLVRAFLAGRKKTTIEAYSRDLQDFARFLQMENANEAATALLALSPGQANALALRFKAYLVDELKLQSSTINRKLSALRSLGLVEKPRV